MKKIIITFFTLCGFVCQAQENANQVDWSLNAHFTTGPYGETIIVGGSILFSKQHAIGIAIGTTDPNTNAAAGLEYLFYLDEISKNRFHPFLAASIDYQKHKFTWEFSTPAYYTVTAKHQLLGELGTGMMIDIFKNFSGRFSVNYIVAEYLTYITRSNNRVPEMSYQREFSVLDSKMGSPLVFKFGVSYMIR